MEEYIAFGNGWTVLGFIDPNNKIITIIIIIIIINIIIIIYNIHEIVGSIPDTSIMLNVIRCGTVPTQPREDNWVAI